MLDSPEDPNVEPLTEALPSNAEVLPPNMDVGATSEERGPSTAEAATTDAANAQPIPETDRSSLVDAGILSSNPVTSPLPTSDAAAPPPDPKISTATQSSRGAKVTVGFVPSKLSSVEALGLLAAEVMAQRGVSSELAACTQNVKRREFEFGRLRRVAMDVATVMHAFVGPSFVVSLLVPSSIPDGVVDSFLIPFLLRACQRISGDGASGGGVSGSAGTRSSVPGGAPGHG